MRVSVIICSKIALEAWALSWHIYKAPQRGGRKEKTLRPMFFVWVFKLCRHAFQAKYQAFYHGLWLYAASKQPDQIQAYMMASLDTLGGVGCPFSTQTHTGAVKARMKGLVLLYYCQVNKYCCFGQSLTLVCH